MSIKDDLKNKRVPIHQYFLIWFSVLVVFIYGFFLYALTHLNGLHQDKVISLNKLYYEVTYAHLEVEEQKKKYHKVENIDFSKVKRRIKNLSLTPTWNKYFFPIYTNKNVKELDSLLKQMQNFENTVLLPAAYQTEMIHDAIYQSVIKQSNHIHDSLERRYEDQQIIIFAINIGFLLFIIIIISFLVVSMRKIKQQKNRLLRDKIKVLKKNDANKHLLYESQKIAKLGYYLYDFKTKNWTASKLIQDLVGLSEGEYNLKYWLEIIHPEDRHILKDILEKRQKNPNTLLDITYRIFVKKTGKMHWIHHKAPTINKDDFGNSLPIIGVLQDVTEFVETNSKLIKTEKDLFRSQQMANIGSYVFNIPKGTWQSSIVLDKIFGINKTLNKPVQEWLNLVHPDEKENLYKYLNNTIKNATIFDKEYRIIRANDKKERWVHGYGKLILDSKGTPVELVGTIQDVTKRKKYEQSLKFNSQKNENLFNQNPISLWEEDFEELEIFLRKKQKEVGDLEEYLNNNPKFVQKCLTKIKIINVNKATLDLLGLKNKADLKKYFAEEFNENSLELFKKLLIKTVLNKQTFQGETEFKKADKTIVKTIIKISVIKNTTTVIVSLVDITILKTIEANLLETRKNLLAAQEIANLGVFSLDIKTNTYKISSTLDTIVGIGSNDLKNVDTWKNIVHPNDFEEIQKVLKNCIKTGKKFDREFRIITIDKKELKWVHAVGEIIFKKGLAINFVGAIQDITQKRHLERNFLNAFIDAQEQEKQNFGENLHDGLSQILAAESMFIEVLIKQNQDRIKDKAKHLLRIRELNNKAFNESRSLAHGLMSKQLKQQGLIKAIEHICIDFNDTKNITFEFKSKGLKEDEINNEIKINVFRIIQEITTNTIRHSLASLAKIELSKIQNDQLKLVYSDNGVGIDFKKLKLEHRGAGLKNIERRITLLNGKLLLESQLDKGVCYTITIPLDY